MQKSIVRFLSAFLVLLSVAGAAAAQTCPTPMSSMFPPAPAAFTHTAVADGGWRDTTTWSGGTIPGNGAVVCIPAGRKVVINRQESARVRFVQVDGQLKMRSDFNTRLYVDTILVNTGGTFQIGAAATPVETGLTAEVIFISWNGLPIDRSWDPEEKSRGLISMGTVSIYGDSKTHVVPMTADALKGSTHLVLDSVPSNWQVGDSLVLPGSYFREISSAASTSQDERITITGISGNAIDFVTVPASTGLAYDHVRPRSDLRLHVANLTRNVVFRSESPASTPLRGHMMMMMGGEVTVSNASLVDLGRTDKTRPLDDRVVRCVIGGVLKACDGSGTQTDYSVTVPAVSAVTNRRGRYALHFHLNGISPGSPSPATVSGTVVDGTTGWGFVNHGSQVDFLNDVAYNFAGAGFVTEAGNELGTFDGDVAIRGTGNGEYRVNQVVLKNAERPQPLADFAFSGDGFWFQGPAIRATNNVAAGCNGVGMIWFTTGQPDINSLYTEGGYSHERYTSFPRSALNLVYAGFPNLSSFVPRYWDNSVTDENLVIGDLPILQCDGFEGYGNLVGFRLRFNNMSGNQTSWYNEFGYDNHIVQVTGLRLRQALKNLKLWNNDYGLYPNYTARGDWSNVTLVNRLDYDTRRDAYTGATINRQLDDSTFNNLTIDGYEVAGLIELINNSSNFNNRSEVTFTGTRTYLNYANFDTTDLTASCNTLGTVTVTTLSATSRKLSWTPNGTSTAIQKRYLVRYRANGDQPWKMVDTTGTSVTLTGLQTGKTYTYQVIAGCKNAAGKETTVSDYTPAMPFNT